MEFLISLTLIILFMINRYKYKKLKYEIKLIKEEFDIVRELIFDTYKSDF